MSNGRVQLYRTLLSYFTHAIETASLTCGETVECEPVYAIRCHIYTKPIICDNATHFPRLVAKNTYVRDKLMRTPCNILVTLSITWHSIFFKHMWLYGYIPVYNYLALINTQWREIFPFIIMIKILSLILSKLPNTHIRTSHCKEHQSYKLVKLLDKYTISTADLKWSAKNHIHLCSFSIFILQIWEMTFIKSKKIF